MNHVFTQQCNAVLRAPDSWDQEKQTPVEPLNVQRTTTTRDDPVVRSFWKPTPEELVLLNAGKAISLDVIGRFMPPVFLHVQE